MSEQLMRAPWRLLGFATALAACEGLSARHLDCVEARSCASDDGGADGGADGRVIVPQGCELARPPKDSPSCVDDAVGVFVSPTGSDTAAGSKSAPVKTIAEGVSLAA